MRSRGEQGGLLNVSLGVREHVQGDRRAADADWTGLGGVRRDALMGGIAHPGHAHERQLHPVLLV